MSILFSFNVLALAISFLSLKPDALRTEESMQAFVNPISLKIPNLGEARLTYAAKENIDPFGRRLDEVRVDVNCPSLGVSHVKGNYTHDRSTEQTPQNETGKDATIEFRGWTKWMYSGRVAWEQSDGKIIRVYLKNTLAA